MRGTKKYQSQKAVKDAKRMNCHERQLRKFLICLGLELCFFTAVLVDSNASAQEQKAEVTVAYRLADQKTLHFDDARKAAEHVEAVKKLGCEVVPNDHDGHNDVTYRCPKWKSLTLASDDLAHQWEEWLDAAGFETLHGHSEEEHAEHESAHAAEHGPEDGEHHEEHEEVEFRLLTWQTLPAQEGIDSAELLAIVKALGCEVQESQSGGPISVRCPAWKHLELHSHEAAESWEKWLSKSGFETKHEDADHPH